MEEKNRDDRFQYPTRRREFVAATQNPLSIMIVDDRPENLSSMSQLLAQDGLEIVTARSGDEALAKMLSLDLALVLLDVQMPGMDGFEVADLMRRNPRTRHFPIIFVTAINKERRHIFSGFEVGAVDYIFKPVDPFIIRSKVQVFLEIKRSALEKERLLVDLNRANRRLKDISDRKSDFLSAASHELRTPLTVIKEYCSLVHDGIVGAPNGEQKKCMQAALRNCNRLADLVNDLLDLDAIESGYSSMFREELDLGFLLREVAEDFGPRCDGVEQGIALDVPDGLPSALGNPDLVTQVLVNLVGNAHKFTPEGGTITLRAAQEDNHLRVAIEDTGPGIAPEYHDKVFEKFTQLNRKDGPGAKGTGLGLAISHKIVELMDGQLGLDSRDGQGATFHFTLPLFSETAHMRAFVADGTAHTRLVKTDWCLVLVRPRTPTPELPEWLAETVTVALRQTDDATTVTQVDNLPVKAVLLQASVAGAKAYLTRLLANLESAGHQDELPQCCILPLDRETHQDFVWMPDKLVFNELTQVSDSKGMSYV
jgi:signal transduction histidine kinase